MNEFRINQFGLNFSGNNMLEQAEAELGQAQFQLSKLCQMFQLFSARLLSYIKVIFYYGCLPLRLSSIEVVSQ